MVTRRTFQSSRRVRVGDCDSTGTIRVDALARYLQDIGYDDTDDIGVGDGGMWVARSIEMNFDTPGNVPHRNDIVELETYCGGVGRAFAQRNVLITTQAGARISTSTIWVSVSEEGKPTAVPQWLLDAYPDAEQMSSKRKLPLIDPRNVEDDVEQIPWMLRASDFDINDHVNNAVAFDALCEVASTTAARQPRTIVVEYHQPIANSDNVTLYYRLTATGFESWLATSNSVSAAMVWSA
jgi:acyl-ACP thioesterase